MPTFSIQIFLAAEVVSRDQGRIIVWAAIGVCLGIYLFYRGFKMLQFKRLILNTPLSKVRSASIGLVELSGMAAGANTIPAGITGEPCYYYRATAWEYQHSGNRNNWKRVADESLFVPFFLQDDTGHMLVNAQGADMDVHRNFKDEFGSEFSGGAELPMGAPLMFLLRHGLCGHRVRLEEYCIKPDNSLFVLGTLGENSVSAGILPQQHVSAISSSISVRWNSRPIGNNLLAILSNLPQVQVGGTKINGASVKTISAPATRAAQAPPAPPPTASKWSDISMDEVHKPVLGARPASTASAVQVPFGQTTAEPQPAAQSAASSSDAQSVGVAVQDTDAPPDDAPTDSATDSAFDLNAPAAIAKGPGGAPFTISSESQRELVRSLGWKSTACIWGGPALAVTCVYLILLSLGLL